MRHGRSGTAGGGATVMAAITGMGSAHTTGEREQWSSLPGGRRSEQGAAATSRHGEKGSQEGCVFTVSVLDFAQKKKAVSTR